MANIITRAGKGAPLSWNEADANFINLNNDKVETSILANYSTTVETDASIAAALAVHTNDAIDAHVSSAIGYLPADTGAVARDVQSKLRESVSVKDFGAVGDGVADDTAAIQDALNTALTNSAIITVPPGIYRLTSSVSLTLTGDNSIHILGSGSGVTVFLIEGGVNGFEFTLPGNYSIFETMVGRTALSIEGVVFATTSAYAGVGLKVTGTHLSGRPSARTYFRDLLFQSYNAADGQFFATGVELINCSSVLFDSCDFYMGSTNTTSKGVYSYSTNILNGGGALHFSDCNFIFGGDQLYVGDQQEGVYVTNCEFIAGGVGIRYEPSTAQSGLHIVGGHMNSRDYNLYLKRLFHFEIDGGLYFSRGTNTNFKHIFCDIVNKFTITGNVFDCGNGATENAIQILAVSADPSSGGVISGNSFHNFPVAIYLGSSSNYIKETGNAYRNCAIWISSPTPSGTNQIGFLDYHETKVFAMAGGSTSENITLTVPNGIFVNKPVSAIANSVSNGGMVGFYDYTNSTTTSLVFAVRRIDDAIIVANNYRFSISAFGSKVV